MDEFEKNKNRKKKRRFLIPLLLVYTLTLCIMGFIIGRASGINVYGQLIDTIVLDSGTQQKTIQNLTIKGRVSYENGEPYRNGVVELHSDPIYTTTDNDGYFTFENVEAGRHTLSVVQDGNVIAKCDVNFNKDAHSDEVLNVKQSDGSYLIEMPTKYLVVTVKLVVNKDGLNITEVNAGTAPPAQSNPGTSAGIPAAPGTQPPVSNPPGNQTAQPGGESPQPSVPVSPTVSPTSQPSPSPSNGGGSSGGGDSGNDNKPHLEAGDSYSSQVWKQMSSVDIFAVRSGNTGIRRIGSDNVICPGTTGSYLFNIKNPDAYGIKFSLSLSESDSNVPHLPMKYRIYAGASGNDSISGSDWKDPSEINLNNYVIAGGETQYFRLEWKWVSVSDQNDTAIGTQKNSPSYILNIVINAAAQ